MRLESMTQGKNKTFFCYNPHNKNEIFEIPPDEILRSHNETGQSLCRKT
jgi:hypothetical protein